MDVREGVRRTAAIASFLLAALPGLGGGEIHGTVLLATGKTYTGPIRWDRNENFWDDTLDAQKLERIERPESGYKFRLFGFRIGDGDSYITHAFSIPFGHLRSLEPQDGGDVLLTLKDGRQVTVRPGSSDLGRGMRGLVVEDPEHGDVDVSWGSLDRVDFLAGKGAGRDAERLWGTVVTRDGELTGSIVWDVDESLLDDVIDGEEDGRDREVLLRDIRSIEPRKPGGSVVVLTDGRSMILEGTNDIDDGQRGVLVTVAGMGRADVPWKSVERVTFGPAPASPAYADFDGGRPLSGTVRTRAGTTLSGVIVWDRDERYTWETLDGERSGIDWSVPFALIESIAVIHDHAEVRLRNSRLLVLEGTNDVGPENKGILVTAADGTETMLEWDDLVTVHFDPGAQKTSTVTPRP